MTIGVGIVGCGFVGHIHAGCVQGLSERGTVDAQVVRVCDEDEQRALSFAHDHGVPTAGSDLDGLLADPAVDAIWVCTPTSTHTSVATAVARAGKALFCEKPLAFDAGGAERLARAVAESGVPSQVGLVLRWSPSYRYMRRRLGRAEGGRPVTAVFRDDEYLPVGGDYESTWRADADTAGAGVLLEHAIHDVDLLRWLLGPVASVTARTRAFAGLVGVEDVGVVTFEFASGAVASLVSVWHRILSRRSERLLEVYRETEMVATSHPFGGPVRVADGISEREVPEDEVVRAVCDDAGAPVAAHRVLPGYSLQVWAFLTALEQGRPPSPSLADAVEAHRILDAVYLSAAEERPVVIPPGTPTGTPTGADPAGGP